MTEPSEELRAVWAQIPDANCKGLCTSACGPVDGNLEERRLLKERGIRLRTHYAVRADILVGKDIEMCPALVLGSCTVYDVRPTVCRLWGAGPAMPCPWGCTPDDPLPVRRSTEIMLEAMHYHGTIPKDFPDPVLETHIEPPA